MKKTISFLYGTLAYLVFLVAFLYAIGFIGDFIVPKNIDTGTEKDFTTSLLINALLLSQFALQHSIMARPAFKRWWTGIIGSVVERSTYVLLSSLSLALIFWQWQPMLTSVWKVESPLGVNILYGLYGLGWLIVFLSTFMINHFELFGLKQVFENARNIKAAEEQNFKVSYFYGIVRHPIMLGFLIAFWATPVMTLGHLVFSITTTLYIFVAVKFLEERDLLKAYGQTYLDYKKKVPMILPLKM
jgi:protein-S-isoprenylcysteine O-methyltransferase Ste14